MKQIAVSNKIKRMFSWMAVSFIAVPVLKKKIGARKPNVIPLSLSHSFMWSTMIPDVTMPRMNARRTVSIPIASPAMPMPSIKKSIILNSNSTALPL